MVGEILFHLARLLRIVAGFWFQMVLIFSPDPWGNDPI